MASASQLYPYEQELSELHMTPTQISSLEIKLNEHVISICTADPLAYRKFYSRFIQEYQGITNMNHDTMMTQFDDRKHEERMHMLIHILNTSSGRAMRGIVFDPDDDYYEVTYVETVLSVLNPEQGKEFINM